MQRNRTAHAATAEIHNAATATVEQRFHRFLSRFDLLLERYAGWILFAFLCIVLLALVARASTQTLWYDEIVIRGVATLPHLRDVWDFYAQGRDVEGPVGALFLRAFLWVPGSPEIAARLPFIFSYLAMLWFSFRFLRRRYRTSYAFAVLLLLSSPPLFELAANVKIYPFELAALSFAMLCWQLSVERNWRPWSIVGLWVGLGLAVAAHKFAIFYFVPFAGAQITRDMERKKPDWPVWAALLLFPLFLLPTLQGDLLAGRYYGGQFWSRPRIGDIHGTFKTYFGWQWALSLGVLVSGLVFAARRERLEAPTENEPACQGLSRPELALISLLALLPVYVVLASYLVHTYRDIYVIACAIGISILLVAGVAEATGRTAAAGAWLALLLSVLVLPGFVKALPRGAIALMHASRVHGDLQQKYDSQPWMQTLEKGTLPIVAGDHSLYTPMHVYAPGEMDKRLYYLTDSSQISRYPSSATSQVNFQLFGSILGFRTLDASTFFAAHRHFLLVIGTDSTMWLPLWLLDQEQQGKASLSLLGPGYGAPSVWDVTLSESPDTSQRR